MAQFLIVGDVDHIQDYVFGSSRLRAVRGASILLDRAAEAVKKSLRGSKVEVLRWRGGQIVACLTNASEDQAMNICARIEKIFRSQSQGESTVTTAYEPYKDEKDFQRAIRVAFRNIQKEKNERNTFGFSGEALLTSPYDRRCDLLPSQAATTRKSLGDDEERIISYAALARWEAVQKRSIFDGYLKQQLLSVAIPGNYKLPYDIDDLWEQKSDGRYVGLVMADGNAFGQMLEAINEPRLYRDFSEQLYRLTLTAVAFAAKKINMKPFPKNNPRWLPLIPIILAGDDLAVLLRAEDAIFFAEELCRQFCLLSGNCILYPDLRKVIKIFRQQDPVAGERLFPGADEEQWQLTLSASVAIAKANFPISILRRFAGELRASAKQGLRRHPDAINQGGMIDFAVVTTATVQPLDLLRKTFRIDESPQKLEDVFKDWTNLTARPYTVEQFERLRLLASSLRKFFPRSKRKFLYRELFNGKRAGKEAFWFILFGLRLDAAKSILTHLHALGCKEGQDFFWEGSKGVVTPLVDALELAELDSEEENYA